MTLAKRCTKSSKYYYAPFLCAAIATWTRYKDRHAYEVFNAGDRGEVSALLGAALADLGCGGLRGKIVVAEQHVTRVVHVTFPKMAGEVMVPERVIVQRLAARVKELPAATLAWHPTPPTYDLLRLLAVAPLLVALAVALAGIPA